MKSEGMFEPYKPKGLKNLDPKFYDSDSTPSWVGMDAWVAAVCFNTVEGAANKLVAPTSWKDLTKPMYKGHVIMPNPNSSGTGFLDVSSWLQMFLRLYRSLARTPRAVGPNQHRERPPATPAGHGPQAAHPLHW